MKFDRRLTDEIYTSDTVRLGKNAFQAMQETIYHNGGVSFRGASGEMILHRLDLKKIFISTGSACDSKNTQKSHVIKAIAVPEEYAYGTIRVSFGKYNSLEDARNIAVEIARILNAE